MNKSGFFDICMDLTGGTLWFVPQIVGQPKPSYRQKSEFECENLRYSDYFLQAGFLPRMKISVSECHIAFFS